MGKYYYNKNFFTKIDTEEKAYWLGFLYADGCINRMYRNDKLKAMDLEIGLCRNDEPHLNKFLTSLESNVEIKRKTNKLNGKQYEASKVVICCTSMCRDLIDKGCTPKKSLILDFPSVDIIPHSFIKDFIRGYFDGDGCVSVNSNGIIQVNFVGTQEFLKGISDYLLSEKIIYKHCPIYQKGNAYQMYIYGADIIEGFYHFLYDDSTVSLDRKLRKFIDFYSTYNVHRKSTSGKQGVYLDKRTNRWCATIYMNGKRKNLGSYSDKNEAIQIRKNFEMLKNAD